MKGYLLYGLTVKLDYYEAKSETLNDQIKINDSDKYGKKNPNIQQCKSSSLNKMEDSNLVMKMHNLLIMDTAETTIILDTNRYYCRYKKYTQFDSFL